MSSSLILGFLFSLHTHLLQVNILKEKLGLSFKNRPQRRPTIQAAQSKCIRKEYRFSIGSIIVLGWYVLHTAWNIQSNSSTYSINFPMTKSTGNTSGLTNIDSVGKSTKLDDMSSIPRTECWKENWILWVVHTERHKDTQTHTPYTYPSHRHIDTYTVKTFINN